MALRIAQPKPLISKPLIVTEVSHNINPLITKVKSPSDTMFNGRVTRSRIGLIMALMIPRNIDPIIIPHKVGSNPGSKIAVKMIAKIFNSQRTTQPCILDSPLSVLYFYPIILMAFNWNYFSINNHFFDLFPGKCFFLNIGVSISIIWH
jgi:hypothetical protein